MSNRTSDYELVIVGAGAAGLGASMEASRRGIRHVVLEAGHRTGGRGLTEYLDDHIPVDLGCHWMHCASRNPYVEWADRLGFGYRKSERFNQALMIGGQHGTEADVESLWAFIGDGYQAMETACERDPGTAVIDCFDLEHPWAQITGYWMTLMHSNDPDQVAVQDHCDFADTNEDWPVREGYGALIAKQGENAPVQLNTAVTAIDTRENPARVETGNGIVRAYKVIVTVSTGILGAGDITFRPALPQTQLSAIEALPLGNYNYQFFAIDEAAISEDWPQFMFYQRDDITTLIHLAQFGFPCVFTSTAGRFAWWLEKQGPEAARAYSEEILVDALGSSIRSQLGTFKTSAWGFDPLVKGAYSSQKPGTVNMRGKLAEPVGEALYFAGEATSGNYLNTAHGAFLSGVERVSEAFPA